MSEHKYFVNGACVLQILTGPVYLIVLRKIVNANEYIQREGKSYAFHGLVEETIYTIRTFFNGGILSDLLLTVKYKLPEPLRGTVQIGPACATLRPLKTTKVSQARTDRIHRKSLLGACLLALASGVIP